MDLPKDFPIVKPRITFQTPVFHPLVNPETGELDLEVENYQKQHFFVEMNKKMKKKTNIFLKIIESYLLCSLIV